MLEMGRYEAGGGKRKATEEMEGGAHKKVASSVANGAGIGKLMHGLGGPVEDGVASLYKTMRDVMSVQVYKIKATSFSTVSTNISYFPVQHSISALFTEQLRARFAKVDLKTHFKAVELDFKHIRVSNPIVLSDQIQITSTGSTEVSSFVQNAKILHFRVGGDSFPAHAYSLTNKSNSALRMKSEDLVGGIKESEHCPWMRDLDITGGVNLPEVGIRAVKMNNVLTQRAKEIVNTAGQTVPIPIQYGYIRDLATTDLKPTVEYLPIEEQECRRLEDLPHEYLEPGKVLEIALPQNVRFSNVDVLKHLSASEPQKIKRGTVAVPLFYAPEGYKCRVETPADGSMELTVHRAVNSRHDWLEHDFLTMVPIRKTVDGFMKLRANVEINVEVDVITMWSNNSLDKSNADQFNLMLHVPQGLPLRECWTEGSSHFVDVMKH